jgi:ribosomal subunit interface protein
MEIVVKGRRTEVNDRFRRHVDTKLVKIEKLDPKVIRVDVEVSQERNPRQSDRRERVELTIHSRGPVIRAEAAADDRFGALDLALGKLEARLRRLSDRRKVHHGARPQAKLATMEPNPEALAETMTGPAGAPLRNGSSRGEPVGTMVEEPVREPASAPVGTAGDDGGAKAADEAVGPEGRIVPIAMDGDGPVVVREKFHKAQPMSIDQAMLEMELVGHDFFLFRDHESGVPSVVYRRRGWDYGVIRLVEE